MEGRDGFTSVTRDSHQEFERSAFHKFEIMEAFSKYLEALIKYFSIRVHNTFTME